jgi:hypothetical protein
MPTPLKRLRTAASETTWFVTIGVGVGVPSAITAASTTAAAATIIAIGAATAGAALVGGAGIYMGYRWLFPKDRRKYHDKPVDLDDLDHPYWSCHIYRVGVVGIKRSGKTEITARLRGKPAGERNTERIETHIFEVDAEKKIFVAFMDGRGADSDDRLNQFEIANKSEILVVVLDHSDKDDETMIEPSRLRAHDDLLHKLRIYCHNKGSTLLKVFFVLNKMDLWSSNHEAGLAEFKRWFENNVTEWKTIGSLSFAEKSLMFSAFKDSDIKLLHQMIVDAAKEAPVSMGGRK